MSVCKLSSEQIAQFRKDGFLHIPALVPDEADMKKIEEAFERVFKKVEEVACDPANRDFIIEKSRTPGAHIVVLGKDGSRFTFQTRGTWSEMTEPSMATLSVRHVAWVGKQEPILAEYGRTPSMLSVAAQLLGADELRAGGHSHFDCIINQAHFKEPKDGVAFPWHQDSMHRRMAFGDFVDVTGRGSYVQLIIAVEDTTPDAGPVRFIPGSNARGHVNGKEGLVPSTVDATTAVAPLLKRGDAVALDPYVIHGSDPNESAHWRRTYINGFAFPGAQQARDRYHWEPVSVPQWILDAV
jgi:hypothetical protein